LALKAVRSDEVGLMPSANRAKPCGICSQIKHRLLVAEATRLGIPQIALAHQREDLIVTLLKDYFIYRYYDQIGRYDEQSFRDFLARTDLDLQEVHWMVQHGLAATMSIRLQLGNQHQLVRPMAYVSESDATEFTRSRLTQDVGSCWVSSVLGEVGTHLTTKREFVHADLRRRMVASAQLAVSLLAIARESLDASGRAKCNPRAARARRLPGFDAVGNDSGCGQGMHT
jgi:hypothetical protein